MRGINFSMRSIFVLVAFVGLGCVALLRAGPIWASGAYTAAVALLLYAVLAAVYRREQARAFWLGAAIVGGVYAWLARPGSQYELYPNTALTPTVATRLQVLDSLGVDIGELGPDAYLISNQLTLVAYEKGLPKLLGEPTQQIASAPNGGYGSSPYSPSPLAFNPASQYGSGGGSGSTIAASQSNISTGNTFPAINDFMQVGHGLWTVVVAMLGGVVARKLYRASGSPTQTATTAA